MNLTMRIKLYYVLFLHTRGQFIGSMSIDEFDPVDPDQHHKRTYVKPDAPNRCQAINKAGEQCLYACVPGEDMCIGHVKGLKKKRVRRYNVVKWKAELERHTDADTIYNIREEIGVLRVVMETLLKKCYDEDELLLRAPQISDLVSKIERIVNSSVKLEQRLRNLLDINAVNQFSNVVINAVIEALEDLKIDQDSRDNALDKIADAIEKNAPNKVSDD